jgi:hypothetical protein
MNTSIHKQPIDSGSLPSTAINNKKRAWFDEALVAIIIGKLLRLHREHRGKPFTVIDVQDAINQDRRVGRPSARMIFLILTKLAERTKHNNVVVVHDTSTTITHLPIHNSRWYIKRRLV